MLKAIKKERLGITLLAIYAITLIIIEPLCGFVQMCSLIILFGIIFGCLYIWLIRRA